MEAAFIPTELDNYIFITPRQATLWIGLDKRTNENVLIRVIGRKDMAETDLSRLTAEIALLQKIDHPLVAKFREIVDTDSYFFFVTDPPKSTTVREYIESHGPVDEEKAQEFLAKYVEIVDYLEKETSRSFVLTIDSVFVDDACCIVQVYVSYEINIFKNQCDIQFKAPETINGQPSGPQAGVWCAGVFLYYITMGKLPFEGSDEQELERNVLSTHPVFPDTASPNLTAFIGKMLTKNPVTRIGFNQFASVTWMKAASSSVLSSFTRLQGQKHRSWLGGSMFPGAGMLRSDTNIAAKLRENAKEQEEPASPGGESRPKAGRPQPVRLTARKFVPVASKGSRQKPQGKSPGFMGNLK